MANAATIPGNYQLGQDEQDIANIMCEELCNAIANGESSNDLENRLAADPRMIGRGVQFRTFGYVNVLASTAAKYGRAATAMFQRFGRQYGAVMIKPDAILGAPLSGNRIVGPGQRTFEIKLPGDKVGRGMKSADQLDRQAQQCEGKRPILIACPNIDGVCTSCVNCPP